MKSTATINATMSTTTSDDVLIGTGKRVVKLGFLEIQVYELELYVNAAACRSLLHQYSGLDLNGLLREPTFYQDFTSSKFHKVFRLKFSRTLSQDKLVGGFEEPLTSRCDARHKRDAQVLLNKLVPPPGVVQGDVLSLVCHGDGETLTGLYLPASGGKEQKLVNIKSGGDGGAWLALQNIYFDDDTQLPTIRVSAIAELPNVLLIENASKEPSEQEIDFAVEENFSNKKKTWSEFAGRTSGGEGYKFGDFTLGVVTAMGLRQKPAAAIGRGELSLTSESTTRRSDKNVKLKRLQQQVEQLERQNQGLQDSLNNTEQILVESKQEVPFQICVALALTEATCILLDSVADIYLLSLSKLQFYLVAAILLGGYKHLVEKKKKKSKAE